MSDDIGQNGRSQSLPQKKLASEKNKVSANEDAHMRKFTLYFVTVFCSFSELTSIIAFFLTKNVEAAILFQFPALLFFYRILCYYYPSKEVTTTSFFTLIQTLLRHKAP